MSFEDVLPTLATKDDLKQFATKADLERFATKEDLKQFATKEDLKTDLQHEMQSLRAFLVDHIGHLRRWVADDVRRVEATHDADRRAARTEVHTLIEAERAHRTVQLHQHDATAAQLADVDLNAKQRDADLDRRVTLLEHPSPSA